MTEFFDFTIWFFKQSVDFFFKLPFLPGIGFGHMLVGVTILAVIIVALVGTIKVASLSTEAHMRGD